MRNRWRNQAGFTLIEILIVMVILGFLVAVVGPNLFNRVSQGQETATRNQLDVFKLGLDNYRLDNGRYPTTEQGLEVLIEKPDRSPVPKNWSGPYLEKKTIPLDSWGHEYHYRCPGQYNTHSYDLWSYGADNEEGGTGKNADITNW